jgi:hypothetical protein
MYNDSVDLIVIFRGRKENHDRKTKEKAKRRRSEERQMRRTRCVVNATNAPALSQSFKAMLNLFQFQGG